MARDLQLQLNMADAFVPHVRRGFVLLPIAPMTGETDEAMRQRVQTCIRRVNAANINLGRKPDVNQAKLWLTLTISQPPERRRRAALAGKSEAPYHRNRWTYHLGSHRARVDHGHCLVQRPKDLIGVHSRSHRFHHRWLWLGRPPGHRTTTCR